MPNKRAYVYRAMVNHAAKDRRATQRRLAREIKAGPRPEVDPRTAELGAIEVRIALRPLTVRQRAIVHLRYWSDLTVPDTSTASSACRYVTSTSASACKENPWALGARGCGRFRTGARTHQQSALPLRLGPSRLARSGLKAGIAHARHERQLNPLRGAC